MRNKIRVQVGANVYDGYVSEKLVIHTDQDSVSVHYETMEADVLKFEAFEMTDCKLYQADPIEPELKPCPFCGGEAEVVKVYCFGTGCSSSGFKVKCRGCEDGRTGIYPKEAEAVAAWNRRSE